MEFVDILRTHGLSQTLARKEVYSLLKTAGRPMSVKEIVQQSPAINRATVYRTIALFNELAITKQVWFGSISRVELSEDFVEHHHHIVCQSCGRVEEFDQTQIEKAVVKVASKSNYKLTGHHIEILGLCADCHNKTLGKT